MEHKRKEFTFKNKKGLKIKLITKPFSFNVEKVVKEFAGAENYGMIQQNKDVVLDVTIEKVKKLYPLLLEGKVDQVNWEDQDYDEVLSVISFFLLYKKNAILRQLQYNSEMFASVIEQAKTVMALMQKNG